MGYHLKKIKKGILGEPSKIQEELDELNDSLEQNNKIMALVEMSDVYGALKALIEKYNFTIDDLKIMHEATERAFKDGSRKSDKVTIETVFMDRDKSFGGTP